MIDNFTVSREIINIVHDAIDKCEDILNIKGAINYCFDDSIKRIDLDLKKLMIIINPNLIFNNIDKYSVYRILFMSIRIIYQAMEIEFKRFKTLFKYYDSDRIELWANEHLEYQKNKRKQYDFLNDAKAFSIFLMKYFFEIETKENNKIKERIKYFYNIF